MKKYILIFLVLVLIGGVWMVAPLNNDYARPVQTQVTALSTTGWIEDDVTATWTYVSANAGGNTFTAYRSGDVTETFAPGMRFRAKQGAGYLNFILHAVSSYDADNDRTTLTLFGGTDYDLADAAITDVAYSVARFPLGFPAGEGKWSVEFSDNTFQSQGTPTTSTWYNINNASIDIPVGLWNVEYKVDVGITTSANVVAFSVSLSTANNTEDENYTKGSVLYGPGSSTVFSNTISNRFTLSLNDETTYYLNSMSGSLSATSIFNSGTFTPTIIRAVSGYY